MSLYTTPALKSVDAGLFKIQSKVLDPASHLPVVSTVTGSFRVLESLLSIIFGAGTTLVAGTVSIFSKKREWKVCRDEAISFTAKAVQELARGIMEAFVPIIGNIVAYKMDQSRKEAEKLAALLQEQIDKMKALPAAEGKEEITALKNNLAAAEQKLATKTKECEAMLKAKELDDSSFDVSGESALFSEADATGVRKESRFHKWRRESAIKKLAARKEELAKLIEEKALLEQSAVEKAAAKESTQKEFEAAQAALVTAKEAVEAGKESENIKELKAAQKAQAEACEAAEKAMKKALSADKKAVKSLERMTKAIESMTKKVEQTQASVDRKTAELEPKAETTQAAA
jgi:hypothetical protein